MYLAVCLGLLCTLARPASSQDAKPAAEKQKEGKNSQDANEKKAEAPSKTEPQEDKASESGADKGTAEEPQPKTELTIDEKTSGGLKASILLRDLNNPCGVSVQPETGDIFISDSGNFRIGRMIDEKFEPVIVDFPQDVYGKGPKVNVGPLGMLFLNKNTLVVGGGGRPDGEELLRVYELPETGKTIRADQLAGSFALAADGDVPGEGNFYALAKLGEHVYVTCNGDDEKGWVSKATIEEGRLTEFERFLATKEACGVNAPVGVTISPIGGYLVVGQMGGITEAPDSLLTFYDVNSGEILQPIIKTGLRDICAVAYSPRRQLYCLDYAWANPSEGGLFQIIEDKSKPSGIRTRKVIGLDKPTAMAFDSDGSLLITVRGSEDQSNSNGALIKIEPGL